MLKMLMLKVFNIYIYIYIYKVRVEQINKLYRNWISLTGKQAKSLIFIVVPQVEQVPKAQEKKS